MTLNREVFPLELRPLISKFFCFSRSKLKFDISVLDPSGVLTSRLLTVMRTSDVLFRCGGVGSGLPSEGQDFLKKHGMVNGHCKALFLCIVSFVGRNNLVHRINRYDNLKRFERSQAVKN